MTHDNPYSDERIVSMYLDGITPKRIAELTGLGYGAVKHIIATERRKRGKAMPYINRQSKFRPKKVVNPMAMDEGILTWAGAFTVLAHYLRDKGDEEGWALAQQIAKEKEMLTL